MAICEKCGKEYNEWTVAEDFKEEVNSSVTYIDYENLGMNICSECATEIYHNGGYFETCECCGTMFNPEDEKHMFEQIVSSRVMFPDFGKYGILCAQCASDRLLNELDDMDINNNGD